MTTRAATRRRSPAATSSVLSEETHAAMLGLLSFAAVAALAWALLG